MFGDGSEITICEPVGCPTMKSASIGTQKRQQNTFANQCVGEQQHVSRRPQQSVSQEGCAGVVLIFEKMAQSIQIEQLPKNRSNL